MSQSAEPPAPHEHEDNENGKNALITCVKAAEHVMPLPRSWWTRWPVLAVVATVLAGLAGLGHVVGGLGEIARLAGERSSSAGTSHTETTSPLVETPPLTLTLSESETRSFDGHKINEAFQLPQDLEKGPLLAGGALTRLTLQANPSHVVEISRMSLEVKPVHKEIEVASLYTVDPTRQSGFGGALPRTFQVMFDSAAQGSANYINLRGESEQASLANLLAVKEFSLLRLDIKEGLQETLDFRLSPQAPGLFEVRFRVYYVSDGRNYEETTKPIYLVRR
jgi:hypothetical protein